MKSPTIKDIAKLARVSVATVSFVLNNMDYKITPETKERVLQAARDLDYQPNAIAQSLRTKKSGIIGLIIPSITNPFYPAVARGVEEAAEAAGFTVFLCNSFNNPLREEKYIRILLQKRIDGLIIASNLVEEVDYNAIFEQFDTKVLSFTRNSKFKNVDFLTVDHTQGGFIATSHLLDQGHKKIAYLGRRMKRLHGYENAFIRKGYQVDYQLVITNTQHADADFGENLMEQGYKEANELLAKRPDVTGIITNDLSAIGVIRAAKDLGMRIPEDLSIVGYDDNPYAAVADPPLTTVEQPKYERGKDAVNTLLSRINNERRETTEIVYQPRLIIRNTTAPPRK